MPQESSNNNPKKKEKPKPKTKAKKPRTKIPESLVDLKGKPAAKKRKIVVHLSETAIVSIKHQLMFLKKKKSPYAKLVTTIESFIAFHSENMALYLEKIGFLESWLTDPKNKPGWDAVSKTVEVIAKVVRESQNKSLSSENSKSSSSIDDSKFSYFTNSDGSGSKYISIPPSSFPAPISFHSPTSDSKKNPKKELLDNLKQAVSDWDPTDEELKKISSKNIDDFMETLKNYRNNPYFIKD